MGVIPLLRHFTPGSSYRFAIQIERSLPTKRVSFGSMPPTTIGMPEMEREGTALLDVEALAQAHEERRRLGTIEHPRQEHTIDALRPGRRVDHGSLGVQRPDAKRFDVQTVAVADRDGRGSGQ